MKSAVLLFPGINREHDMALALEKTTGKKPHVVWHTDTSLPDVDLVVVPGGFSYGDYLRCGAIAARSPIMADVKAKALKGLKVLAVCNGFQIVTEAGLLPGALVRNAGLKFGHATLIFNRFIQVRLFHLRSGTIVVGARSVT